MTDAAYDQKSLVYRFKKHLETRSFFKANGFYLIGCSGGADSVALFHLMRMAFPNIRLGLAHFNHGLRAKTATRDEFFVKKLAAQYGMPFFLGRAIKAKRKKVSIEELAREQRYQFLRKIYQKRKFTALFLAHHADDQAETVLMRMCQGTGPRGLEAVREVLLYQKMVCARPLLPFTKIEIASFMKQHRFDFCEDETNESNRFLRNRLRLEVLPYLKTKVNPQIVRALARIPDIVRDENELLELLEVKATKKILIKVSLKGFTLRASLFRRLHPALQFRVLDRLLKRLNPGAGLLFDHFTLVRNALKKPVFALDLPGGIRFSANRTEIRALKLFDR